jgi:tetratricopeptide (TPR) repeat protein
MVHRFDTAIEKLNLALAIVPNWVPALVEKMKIVLGVFDWDQAQDIASRILGIEENLEAHRFKILYVLCKEGNTESTKQLLDNFLYLCKKNEPHNSKYFVENGSLFSQIASFSPPVVNEALRFVKYATELEIDNAEFVADVGRIYLLLGKTKEAHQEFKLATDMDNTSIAALYGSSFTCSKS